MSAQHILGSYVKASSDVLVNPGNNDFGSGYTGQTLTKEYSIAGFDLSPAAGSFTLTVSEGFGIALQRTDAFCASLSLNYSNGNLDYTRFYVSANLTAEVTKAGTLTISNGTISKSYELQANCIVLSGGTPVKLRWELTANTDVALTGPAKVMEESFSNMYVQRYSAPNAVTYWPAASGYDATRKTQRTLLVGDAWPAGEIDEVSTRYIQFGVKANPGSELNIDSIGLYVCGAGGNGMRCRISYSTDNFATYKAIAEFQSMVANTMYAVEAIPVVKLNAGDSLLLRIYPWYNAASTGKTICLADVTIRGIATSATAVTGNLESPLRCSVREGIIIVEKAAETSLVLVFNSTGMLLYTSKNSGNQALCIQAPTVPGICFLVFETSTGKVYRKLIH